MRLTVLQHCRLVAFISILTASLCLGQTTRPAAAQDEQSRPELKLYCVGYTHLDTQWRWSYPQVIAEFLRNTLHDNFGLFEKYPHYIFNFTGANRYMMFKEYYPADYQKLKQFVAAGRWFPGGSSVEEGDVNMPDGEAIVRQVLYGNEFFRREFGKQSTEFMLPDCFGFQASLPSVLAHCGITGFSTQKLTWGSAVGIPFNVGVWEGPDGGSVVAALNPGDYNGSITEDLSYSQPWQARIEADGRASGFYSDFHYYGAGDRGGAPRTQSLELLEKSIAGGGPVKVISATSEQMFKDITPQQIAKLPRYKGDLLLTGHSTGELTSQAFIKRLNRKNEQLADAAERASVAADWLGAAPYPMEKINRAWILELGAHFHDTMAGTALPKTYEYSWNNEFLAANQFAAALEDGAGAVARGMDTRTQQGTPIIVFNPLSIEREDVAEATVTLPRNATDAVAVFDPAGHAVPSQVVERDGDRVKLLFLAKVPTVGFATFEVRSAAANASPASDLSVSESGLENKRFRVTLNRDGDIASIFDKANHREVLSAPARLAFLYEKPQQYPAWNMDYDDRMRAPLDYVHGPCKVRVVENGPARVAIEVERQTQGSRFVQQIRLSSGEAGNRVEVSSVIDWQTRETSLEAVFPLTVGNPMATYESQSAAVQRGNNDPKKFEVPQQQWFDVTGTDGAYGTAILNDCKYGSDKPDDHTVRLTLLYTPGVRGVYQDQATQDIGRHEMVYAIAPHAGSWQQGATPWEAQRLNQPLMTFQSGAHDGTLGRSFSLLHVNSDHVTVTAIKKAEDSDETIVRLHEVAGETANDVRLQMAGAIQAAREVDGQERPIGKATVENGELALQMKPFSLRAFALKIALPPARLIPPVCQTVPLVYDLDAVSRHANLSDGGFDVEGHTLAADALPAKIVSEGIEFTVGPTEDGKKNALVCRGQTVQLPAGDFSRVYLLAAGVYGDQSATFDIDGHPQQRNVEDWSTPVGEWDNRLWQGVVPGLTYSWDNKFAGLEPGFTKRGTVAWYCSHRHHPERGNEYYQFTYLFKLAFDLPPGAKSITLPDNDRVRIFAMTVATNRHDDVRAARPLYDTLDDHKTGAAPMISSLSGGLAQNAQVRIDHSLYWREGGLHYTTDGSQPTAGSPAYDRPIWLGKTTTVRAVEIDTNGNPGPEVAATFQINDTTAPAVVSVTGMSISPTLTVAFSEPLNKDEAEAAQNYRLDPAIAVSSAKLSEDGLRATLTLASPPQSAGDYHLTITGVHDRSANANVIASTSYPVALAQPVAAIASALCAGNTIEQRISGLPIHAGDPWTINVFAKPSQKVEDRTVIAGFGFADDSGDDGTGRYLAKFSNGIHFWSRHRDVESRAPLETNRWVMLSATYDGKTVRLYKNGQPIGDRDVTLSDDESIVRLAPLDPWDHRRQFKGELRDFTVWREVLPASDLQALQATMAME